MRRVGERYGRDSMFGQRAWVDAALRRFAVETIAAPFHPGWLTADVARSLAHLLTEHARRLEAEGGS